MQTVQPLPKAGDKEVSVQRGAVGGHDIPVQEVIEPSDNRHPSSQLNRPMKEGNKMFMPGVPAQLSTACLYSTSSIIEKS